MALCADEGARHGGIASNQAGSLRPNPVSPPGADGTRSTAFLSSFIAETRFTHLPPQTTELAKRCLRDSLACAFGGSVTDPGSKMLGLYADMGGNPEATLFPCGPRVPVPNAVSANALFNPSLAALAKRVSFAPDAAFEGPTAYGGRVTVFSGTQSKTATVLYPRGHPRNPLSERELVSKFSNLVDPVLGRERSTQLLCTLDHIDTRADIREQTRMLWREE